jgi:phospholipid/cholesterol/gamma-HCH transport system substrate-binding protein
MYRMSTEITVGAFVMIGLLCMAYLTLYLGGANILREPCYRVTAEFTCVTGLHNGASVEIAGVPVGHVLGIALADNQAIVTLGIREGIRLSEDTIASIRTKGLIGEMFVKLTPGGAGKKIEPGAGLL